MFGRATITLGIGPHSSLYCIACVTLSPVSTPWFMRSASSKPFYTASQKMSERTLFLSFFISPGSAEALVRWGRKTKYFRLPASSVTFVPNIIEIDSCMSKLQRDKVVTFWGHSVLLTHLISHTSLYCQLLSGPGRAIGRFCVCFCLFGR